MKIIHVNTSDIRGGTARAAYRLHHALLARHMDSKMLVQFQVSDDYTVLGLESKIAKGLAKVRTILNPIPLQIYQICDKTLFSPDWLPFSKTVDRINSQKPDIVHLHRICGAMLRITDIKKINAPIVWSLHDMWPFTGGCHYDQECGKYKLSCGSCIVLGSSRIYDLSQKMLKQKKNSFSRINNLTIVGLSKWLANCASQSSLFKNRPVVNLPNLIDTEVFSPVDSTIARNLLGLPQKKNLILFGAMDRASDPRKGLGYLNQALEKLNRDNIELIMFGSGEPEEKKNLGFKIHYLGDLSDNISLKIL